MPELDDEKFAEAVVRTLHEPLLVLDAELRVQSANPAFYRAFRIDAAALVGRSLFAPDGGGWDFPALRQLLEELLPRQRSIESFEIDHDFPVGRRSLLLNARRLELGPQRPPMILLALHDVTVEREMRRELERSNRDLERFAYVASHDLQEPLRMVASYTRLLARRYRGRLDERADKYIDYAAGGAERMKKLIQDLLSYSRIGTQGGEAVPTDSGEVLTAVLRDLYLRIRDCEARVTVEPLPTVLADPRQLRQLLQNLVENALKFSGEEAPAVRVSGRLEGAWAVLSVADEGIGIEPQYFDRIFEIFQRLHAGDARGTGIGLALCKRIVERHGGRIWVESEPGAGATFHFTLPAASLPIVETT